MIGLAVWLSESEAKLLTQPFSTAFSFVSMILFFFNQGCFTVCR